MNEMHTNSMAVKYPHYFVLLGIIQRAQEDFARLHKYIDEIREINRNEKNINKKYKFNEMINEYDTAKDLLFSVDNTQNKKFTLFSMQAIREEALRKAEKSLSPFEPNPKHRGGRTKKELTSLTTGV